MSLIDLLRPDQRAALRRLRKKIANRECMRRCRSDLNYMQLCPGVDLPLDFRHLRPRDLAREHPLHGLPQAAPLAAHEGAQPRRGRPVRAARRRRGRRRRARRRRARRRRPPRPPARRLVGTRRSLPALVAPKTHPSRRTTPTAWGDSPVLCGHACGHGHAIERHARTHRRRSIFPHTPARSRRARAQEPRIEAGSVHPLVQDRGAGAPERRPDGRLSNHRRGAAGVERSASSRCTAAGRTKRPDRTQIRGGTADGTRNASIRTRRIVTCRAASRSPWPAAARNRRISRARSRCAPSRSTVLSSRTAEGADVIRSLCTWWFRASNVITDTVRFERSSAARGSAVARKAETIGLEAMARRRAPTPATAGCRPHATPGPALETAGSMTGSTSGSEGGSGPKPVRTGLSGESRLSGCTTTHRIRPAVFPTTRDARCPLADTCARTLLVTPGTADPARAQDTTCLPSSPTTRAGQVTTSCNLVGIYRPHDPRDRQQQQRRVPAAERRLSGSEGGSGRNPSGPGFGEADRADVRRRAG